LFDWLRESDQWQHRPARLIVQRWGIPINIAVVLTGLAGFGGEQ